MFLPLLNCLTNLGLESVKMNLLVDLVSGCLDIFDSNFKQEIKQDNFHKPYIVVYN